MRKLKSIYKDVYSEFEAHILGSLFRNRRVCAGKFIYKLRRISRYVHSEIEEPMLGSLIRN